ncbi:MAG: hypothetical protein HN368_16685 [Spirochaetales bacterium]|jgi:hypothetical protein|nr:hypothetical protein [Spirochaetales bacterium]
MTNKLPTYIRLFFLIFAAFLLFAACEQDPILTEYDGINLIANSGFANGWVLDTGTEYMLFEEVTDIGEQLALGLPVGIAGEAVYRLEIRNLVPDGDFESTAAGFLPSLDWSAVDGGSGTISGGVSSAYAATGSRSLYFSLDEPEDVISYSLAGLTDFYPADAKYILRFDLIADVARILRFYFPSSGLVDLRTAEITPEDVFETVAFPDAFELATSTFTSTGPVDFFYITDRVQSGYIDNLRITRRDEPLHLRLPLTWFDTDRPTGSGGESLNLVSGYYEFAVWVKEDPSVGTGAAPNRFSTDNLTIGINESSSVYTEAPTVLDLSEWVQITQILWLQIDAPADPADTTPIIELVISPTDILNTGSLDVGSICMVNPELYLYSNNPL